MGGDVATTGSISSRFRFDCGAGAGAGSVAGGASGGASGSGSGGKGFAFASMIFMIVNT